MKIPSLFCGALFWAAPMISQAQTPSPTPPADCPPGMMQPGESSGGRPAPLEMLSKRLNLTEDQKAKIKPLIDEAAPQIQAIHEEARAKIKAVLNGVHDKVKPMLTPEQQQKLEELKTQMENMPHPGPMGMMNGRWENFGKNGGVGGGPGFLGNMAERMAKELNLTQDQQNQLKPIFEETRSQIKAVWEDSSLTPDQKRAKGQEIREASRAKISAVLTPDQQQRMQQLRKEHGPGKQE